MIEVNYMGSVYPTRAVITTMKERRMGRIMFVSSQAGQIGLFGYTAYSPSKFALRGLAEALQMEVCFSFFLSISFELFATNKHPASPALNKKCMKREYFFQIIKFYTTFMCFCSSQACVFTLLVVWDPDQMVKVFFVWYFQIKPYNIYVTMAFPPDTDTPLLAEENNSKVSVNVCKLCIF